jgi:hypothetical protein
MHTSRMLECVTGFVFTTTYYYCNMVLLIAGVFAVTVL